ncbi:MAG: DUF2130 domain-containing protein [bacterium]
MSTQTIICTNCKHEIQLTEAIESQLRGEMKKEFDEQAKLKEKQFAEKEQVLLSREQKILESQQSLEQLVLQKVAVEREKVVEEVRKEATDAYALKFKDMRLQIEEKNKKIEDAQKHELELRKQQRELEEKGKGLELEMARKLDDERKKIWEDAAKKSSDEHRMKELEKEKQINDLLHQIDDLKRRAQQGSQQTQGEVLELELEELLRSNFPYDQIEPVAKGIRGADIIQKVFNTTGQHCGTIIWESKQTKSWSDGWVDKLKQDQREMSADVAVLLSSVLPKEVRNFGYVQGVWVTNYDSMLGLSTALRIQLVHVAAAKFASVGKNEKMEVLYSYLSGPEFRQRVEGIVEAFNTMRQDLDQEKRAMIKIWAKREKQIERVVNNTVRMYGSLHGIIGASLPQIESLEFEALEEGGGEDEETGGSGALLL